MQDLRHCVKNTQIDRKLTIHSLILQLAKLLLHQIASQGTEMADEQYAVAVVGLMQKATRCESGCLALERFPLNILRSQDSPVGSFQICGDLANREATLLAGLFA